MSRSRLMHRTLLLWLLLATHSTTAASPAETTDSCEVPAPITAPFLLSLNQIPRAEPAEDPDGCFWELVRGGMPLVPELIELTFDATITRHLVPLFGGSYAVGDIATVALMQIAEMPVLDLVMSLDPDAPTECGFCAYWDFVRADPKHRLMLRAELHRWYEEHASQLQWKPNAYQPAGGIWGLPVKPERPADEVEN